MPGRINSSVKDMDRRNPVVMCTKKRYLEDKAVDKRHVLCWHLVFSRVTA